MDIWRCTTRPGSDATSRRWFNQRNIELYVPEGVCLLVENQKTVEVKNP